MLDFDDLFELRREAFVRAFLLKSRGKRVVGYFGDVDEARLRAFLLFPIPIVSIDAYIFKYGFVNSAYCDAINATNIYLKTNKCPLLFSSEFFVVDDMCECFNKFLRSHTKKLVLNECDLDFEFNDGIYNESREILDLIEEKLDYLSKTNISDKMLAAYKFFTKFEFSLEKRLELIEEAINDYDFIAKERVSKGILCPFGIINGLLDEGVCYTLDANAPYVAPNGCVYCAKKYIHYEGEDYGSKS